MGKKVTKIASLISFKLDIQHNFSQVGVKIRQCSCINLGDPTRMIFK